MDNLFYPFGEETCLKKSAECADVPSAYVNTCACKFFNVCNRHKVQRSVKFSAKRCEFFFIFFTDIVVNYKNTKLFALLIVF